MGEGFVVRGTLCGRCGDVVMESIGSLAPGIYNLSDSRPHDCVLQSPAMKQPTFTTKQFGITAELSETDRSFIEKRANIVKAQAAAGAAVAAGLRLQAALGPLDPEESPDYLRWEKYLRRIGLDIIEAGREAQDWCNAEIDRAVANQVVILEARGQLTLFDGASDAIDATEAPTELEGAPA